MADIIDIARGVRIPTFGQQANTLRTVQSVKSNTRAPYYLRLSLSDKPGALAKVASLLGDFGISIDRMRQYAHADAHAPVLIVTHNTDSQSIEKALANLPKTRVVHDKPVALRIEPL
jgi:homoserine dehydrogenase